MDKVRQDIIERITKRCSRSPHGCLVWHGRVDTCGYGQIRLAKKTERVHRAMFAAYGGVLIGKKAHVLHKCDNPGCCEITHLYAGSPKDNTRDKCLRGRCRTWKKRQLSADEVTSIRILRAVGFKLAHIGRVYERSEAMIHYIVKNTKYRFVQGI